MLDERVSKEILAQKARELEEERFFENLDHYNKNWRSLKPVQNWELVEVTFPWRDYLAWMCGRCQTCYYQLEKPSSCWLECESEDE